MERYDWKDLQPTQTTWNWTQMDSDILKYKQKGKKVSVLVSLVSDNVGPTTPNTATPQWALSKVTIITCSFAPLGVPAMYEQKTMNLTQPFILKLLQHLDGNSSVAYVRVGLFLGGENCPICMGSFPNGETTALQYLKAMADWLNMNHPNGTGKTLLVENCSGCKDKTYSDQSAKIFAEDNIGIGMEAVSEQDYLNYIAGQDCLADWCGIFNTYPSAVKYLQPFDPQPVDGLLTYYPFATEMGTNWMELATTDLSVAYYPQDPNYNRYGLPYRNALMY